MFEESLHLLSLSRRRRTERFRHDVSTKIGALDVSKLDITRCNVAPDEEHGVFYVSHTRRSVNGDRKREQLDFEQSEGCMSRDPSVGRLASFKVRPQYR